MIDPQLDPQSEAHSGAQQQAQQAPTDSQAGREAADSSAGTIAGLVGQWLDWKEAARLLGVPTSKIGHLIRDHQLAGLVPRPGAGQQVPAEFILDGEIVKGVPGVLTVLHDGGYDDLESLLWLFTADDTLPGRPIDALRENRGSEIKRRAQAMAF